jgi:olefin beta-lactone synthetase
VTASGPSLVPRSVSGILAERARSTPLGRATIDSAGLAWRETTFAELDSRCDAIAHGLSDLGLRPGDRAALLVPPGREFVAAAFALFRLGAIPVVADPGMGALALARSLGRAKPRALIGSPAAHVLHAVRSRELSSIRISVSSGKRRLPGLPTLESIAVPSRGVFRPTEPAPDDEAAVLFTSGSTGPAKGVVYAHANFLAQLESLRALYAFAEGEVDLACFPLFALFAPALGMACAFPKLDPRRPGRCDPAGIVRAARETGATSTFGSPAIWRRVVPWALERGEKLPSLRRALVAGAPVEPALVEGLRAILAHGADVHTPYGQTEALPLASISGAEILARRARIEGGAGNCVGRPAPGIEIAVIAVGDRPIARWSEDLRLPRGELGEICARGPVVTRSYADDPDATAAAKIPDGASIRHGPGWHRTGDLGYFDEEGLLWFCGRKSHRLETERGLLAPVPTENVLNRHPRVARTALVGVGPRGRERAALVVEPVSGAMPRGKAARERFAVEVRELLARRRPDSPPRGPDALETVLFKSSFPVDARHNAKIRSEELKRWAEKRLR